MPKVQCSECGRSYYDTLDPTCDHRLDHLDDLLAWAVMASELLKVLGKADTVTVIELDKVIAYFDKAAEAL